MFVLRRWISKLFAARGGALPAYREIAYGVAFKRGACFGLSKGF